MAIKVQNLEIPDVMVVESPFFQDDRGYFLESFKQSDFEASGLPNSFYQDNLSFSHKGVLRGLHYQLPPYAQGKLVRVIQGLVWDVAVDIRKSSPTFKKWVAMELSEENQKALYIPPGCAHGFVVLSDSAKMLYKVTAEYNQQSEGGIVWNDPELGIDWPVEKPFMSEKDSGYPSLSEAKIFE